MYNTSQTSIIQLCSTMQPSESETLLEFLIFKLSARSHKFEDCLISHIQCTTSFLFFLTHFSMHLNTSWPFTIINSFLNRSICKNTDLLFIFIKIWHSTQEGRSKGRGTSRLPAQWPRWGSISRPWNQDLGRNQELRCLTDWATHHCFS